MTARLEPIIIGALLPGDVDRCAELDAPVFAGDDPWSATVFARDAGIACLDATGFTGASIYEVRNIAVDPSHRGQGIGRRLLEELLQFAAGGAADHSPLIASVAANGHMAPDLHFDVHSWPANLFHDEGVQVAQRTAKHGLSGLLDVPLHPRQVAGRFGCDVLVKFPSHVRVIGRELDVVIPPDLLSANIVKILAHAHRYDVSQSSARHSPIPAHV